MGRVRVGGGRSVQYSRSAYLLSREPSWRARASRCGARRRDGRRPEGPRDGVASRGRSSSLLGRGEEARCGQGGDGDVPYLYAYVPYSLYSTYVLSLTITSIPITPIPITSIPPETAAPPSCGGRSPRAVDSQAPHSRRETFPTCSRGITDLSRFQMSGERCSIARWEKISRARDW